MTWTDSQSMSLRPDYEDHWKKEKSYFQKICYEALWETQMIKWNPFISQSHGRTGLRFLIMSNAGEMSQQRLDTYARHLLTNCLVCFLVFFFLISFLSPFHPHPIYSYSVFSRFLILLLLSCTPIITWLLWHQMLLYNMRIEIIKKHIDKLWNVLGRVI